MRRGRVVTMGLREQRAWMTSEHPQFSCRLIKDKRRAVLVCRGAVQPTPINAVYKVRIEYSTGRRPRVWIESPPLRQRSPQEPIPHTYGAGRPCLFFDEFRGDMRLSQTIVPWLACWLIFYEVWLVTGEWHGGGVHPGSAGLSEPAA